MIIIGIDPGSRVTGYGVLAMESNKYRYLDSGTIVVKRRILPHNLQEIYEGISLVIAQYQPQIGAIESIFFSRNINSAFKLGQARGASLVALGDIEVQEYSPREVKQAVAGNGAATKEQVQFMVKKLLGLKDNLPSDASDALAVALCEAHCGNMRRRLQRISS